VGPKRCVRVAGGRTIDDVLRRRGKASLAGRERSQFLRNNTSHGLRNLLRGCLVGAFRREIDDVKRSTRLKPIQSRC
jgi:hypothetical protein